MPRGPLLSPALITALCGSVPVAGQERTWHVPAVPPDTDRDCYMWIANDGTVGPLLRAIARPEALPYVLDAAAEAVEAPSWATDEWNPR